MPAPVAAAAVPLLKGLLGGLGRGALMGGRSALMTGVRAGARGGIRQGIRSGVRQGARNTMRGGIGGRGGGGRGGNNRGGGLVKQTNDSAITRSENGGLAVQGRTIKEGGALTSSMGPTSQKSSAIVKTGPTKDNVLGLLEQIKQTADQILEVEVKELDNDNKEYKDTKKEQEKERKLLEGEKRDEEENKQEEKKAKKGKSKKNPVVKAAKKGLGNIFEFLMGIFKDFILYKVLDWVADPKNRKKVTQLVKFIGAIPGALKFLWERFVEPWWEFSKKLFGGGFKIFMAFFNVAKDVITLKWLTNPGEFFNTLMEIPKTLIEVVPGIIGSLLNAITGGAVSKIGDLVGGLFNNPLKGIDLGNVGSLLGSAANFVKGLLGNAWTGITNLVGGLFGGGGGDKKKTQPSQSRSGQGGRNRRGRSTTTTTTSTPPTTQPATRAPITKTSGTEAFGDRNYGIKEGGFKTVEHEGVKYYFTRRKDGTWGVHKMGQNRRGTATVRKGVDASKVSGLVQAFDKEHGQKQDDPVTSSADTTQDPQTQRNSSGYSGQIKYFSSNGGGVNMSLKPGQSYSFNSIRLHHGEQQPKRQDGWPRDYTLLHGTDLNSAPNADIPVPLDSEVTHVQSFSGYGNTVILKNATGNMLFAHLSKFGKIKVGDKIKAGTIIGTQGSTGGNYADHLHLEAEAAGHEAFINYITGGKPTYGSSPGTGEPSAPPAAITPQHKDDPSTPPKIAPTPPSTGSNLGSAQRESRSLSQGGSKGSSPTVINNSSSTQATQKATETAVGSTLPTSGLWAIYSYQL